MIYRMIYKIGYRESKSFQKKKSFTIMKRICVYIYRLILFYFTIIVTGAVKFF